jgi:hypothetical protein
MPQYAKTLQVHRGVDNRIQFQFLNQEQKPFDITGLDITFRILNGSGNKMLLSKTLDLDYALTGIASVNLGAAEVEGLDAQKAYYTLEIPQGSSNYPVYVDPAANARGDLLIVNSILPSFVPSFDVTIPTGQAFPNTPNANGGTYTYTTSVLNTQDSSVLTLQAQYSGFYGNVKIQGSTSPSNDWYDINTETGLANLTETRGYVIQGFHPYVQVSFTSNAGSVTNILTR